jgi:hypothetical protein
MNDTPMEAFRRSVGFQFGFVLISGLEVKKGIDHVCSAAEKLVAASHSSAVADAIKQERARVKIAVRAIDHAFYRFDSRALAAVLAAIDTEEETKR